jgi:hypothetical protein
LHTSGISLMPGVYATPFANFFALFFTFARA